SPTPSPSPSPSPATTPTPTPVITEPPTPIPTNPQIWSPSQAANDLRNVVTAIDSAHLNFAFDDPRDEDMLRKLAADVQKPLDKANRVETARAVQKLSQKLQQIVDAGRLHNAAELQNAVSHLVDDVG